MENELRCPVCHEFFTDPVMLNCTHHICQSHVPRGDRHLPCPVCGDLTVLPTDGAQRVDKALQVVVDVWKDKQKVPQQNGDSSPSRPPVCGFCEEKPATRRCQQCDGVLCEECEKTSHSKGFFKSHNIVDLELVGPSSSPMDEYLRRMTCEEHREEKLTFYCLDCRRPVCSHCLILGEHKGHQQTPMDQAFVTAKDTLSAWVGKLRERSSVAEELLEALRAAELEVQRGAEGQRNLINQELDHLRELIETKRHQLLSKSALEEKQKRVQLQAQVDRAETVQKETASLVGRSKEMLALPSEHAFLAVVLPLIQDMKKCASHPVDAAPLVSSGFRPLSTDAQVRSLGDLDLGHPRAPQHNHAHASVTGVVGQAGGGLVQQVPGMAQVASLDASAGGPANYPVLAPAYAASTMSFMPAQPPVYVYRSVHAP